LGSEQTSTTGDGNVHLLGKLRVDAGHEIHAFYLNDDLSRTRYALK